MATKTKQAAKAAEPAAVDASMAACQDAALAVAKAVGSIEAALFLERLRTHILETMPKRVA